MQPVIILNAIGGAAVGRGVGLMGDAAAWRGVGGWGEVCCTDGFCWGAGEGVVMTADRGAEAVADGWKISDGAKKGAVGGLGIFEGAVRGAAGGAVEDAVADAGGDADSLGISDGAKAGGLEISEDAEAGADGDVGAGADGDVGAGADGDVGAGAGAVDTDGTFWYVGELGRNDGLNGDLDEGFDAVTRVFSASRNDLILNEVNFSSSSHFSISCLDHAVRSLSFSVSASVFAIEILPSWDIHTPRILRKCRNPRNCILLIRLKSSFV